MSKNDNSNNLSFKGKNNKSSMLGYIVLAAVTILAALTGIYTSRQIEQRAQEKLTIIAPSQYPDFDAIKGKNPDKKIKRLNITYDCPEGGCVSDKPAQVDFADISKKYKVTGKFSRAYLFVEAMVDYNRPLTSWDDIYFKISNQGGHLIVDENVLLTPPGATSTYLYNLSSVSFYPKLSDKMKKIHRQNNFDMFSLLEDGSTFKIIATVSSLRKGRVMKEFSIYYECSEGSECSITEVPQK